MADYTVLYEASQAIVELLRRNMSPEPISKPELIGLCTPYEPEDYQLTVHLYHVEDGTLMGTAPFRQESYGTQRATPLPLKLSYLITAHSKAPVQSRAADEYRIIGRVMQIMRDNSRLSGDLLPGSLREGEEPVHLDILRTTYEQMLQIWNSNTKPYKLSLACQLTALNLESNRTRSYGRVRDIQIEVGEGVRHD